MSSEDDFVKNPFDVKINILNNLLQSAIEQLCAHAKTNGYLSQPYGRHPLPTPLISEEQFVEMGALNCDDESPEFLFSYGFDPLQFVADYLLWAHPDAAADRQQAKVVAQASLHKRAEHAQLQLAVQKALCMVAVRSRSAILWGPLTLSVSSTTIRLVVQPSKPGIVYIQVSPSEEFDDHIPRVVKCYAKSSERVSEQDDVIPARFIDIDQLQEQSLYFFRVVASPTEDFPPLGSNKPPPKAVGKQQKSAAVDNVKPPEFIELSLDENADELSSALDLLKGSSYYCQSWTSPGRDSASSSMSLSVVGQLPIISLQSLHQKRENAKRRDSLLMLEGESMIREPETPKQLAERAERITSVSPTHHLDSKCQPGYSVLLGDLLLHQPGHDAQSESVLFRQYREQIAHQIDQLSKLKEFQTQSCVLSYRDSNQNSAVQLRNEEAAYKQYRHDLRKYNKKHGLDDKSKTKRENASKANLPPAPSLILPPLSPQMRAITQALPMMGASLCELENSKTEGIHALFRSFQIGTDVEVFVLDARRGSVTSSGGVSLSCDYLGREQCEWLRDALMRSSSTWKIICVGKSFGLCREFISAETSTQLSEESMESSLADFALNLAPQIAPESDYQTQDNIEQESDKPLERRSVLLVTPVESLAQERERLNEPVYNEREDKFDRFKHSLQNVLATLQREAKERDGPSDEVNDADGIVVHSGIVVVSGGITSDWTKVLVAHEQHGEFAVGATDAAVSVVERPEHQRAGTEETPKEKFENITEFLAPPFVAMYFDLESARAVEFSEIDVRRKLEMGRPAYCVEIGLGNGSHDQLHNLQGIRGLEASYEFVCGDGDQEDGGNCVCTCVLEPLEDGALNVRIVQKSIGNPEFCRVLFEQILCVPESDDSETGSVHVA